MVVALVLIGVFGLITYRSRANERLKHDGIPGTAQVLAAEQTGMYVNHQPQVKLRLRVEAHSGLDGLAMRDLSARTRVVGLRRAPGDVGDAGDASLEHPPRRDTRFAAGDEAFLVGPDEELLEVLARSRAEAPAVAGGRGE